jgi:hypothetical protein
MSEITTQEESGEELAVAPSTNLLHSLESAITSLAADTPTESLLCAREELLFYKQESVRMLAIVDSLLIDRINASGPIQYGNGVRFYVSHPKTTKCRNLKAAIDALAVATGGEEQLFLGCFSSNAIKYGQAKKHLTKEQYDKLFETVVKDKLEDGSEAPKRLVKADDKWRR